MQRIAKAIEMSKTVLGSRTEVHHLDRETTMRQPNYLVESRHRQDLGLSMVLTPRERELMTGRAIAMPRAILTLKILCESLAVPGTYRANRSRKCCRIFAQRMGETLTIKGFGVDCPRTSRYSGEIS